jgi:hypothetical protein
VVYIRQGPPDATATTTRGIALELWVYDRPDPLVLSFREVNFDGQIGASQLVPTLLSENPILRDQVCALKASLCSTNGDVRTPTLVTTIAGRPAVLPPITRANLALQSSGLIATGADQTANEQDRLKSGAQLRLETEEGKAAIDIATTTDAYPRHFDHSLTPAVQIYGLDRASGGSPRLIATFAIPAGGLSWSSPPAAGGRAVYPVRLQLRAANRTSGEEFQLDTVRRFATAKPLGAGESIIGYLELPLRPGRYATSLSITQEDGRGAIANLGEVVVPGATRALAASDLVLGLEEGGVRWNSGAISVSFNPLNSYHSGAKAEAYYQLSGLQPGGKYQTQLVFFKVGDDPKRGPRLTISATEEATTSRMEVSRALVLKGLAAGSYRVVLTVRGHYGSTTAEGWVNVAN